MTTVLDRETQQLDSDGSPMQAHIIVTPAGNAAAKVLEARIFGLPLTALCGRVFTPQRDPRALPVCPRCKEIHDAARAINSDLCEISKLRQ